MLRDAGGVVALAVLVGRGRRGRRHDPGSHPARRAAQRHGLAAVRAARAAAPRSHHHRDEPGLGRVARAAHRRALARRRWRCSGACSPRATRCSAHGPRRSCPTWRGTRSSPAPSSSSSWPGIALTGTYLALNPPRVAGRRPARARRAPPTPGSGRFPSGSSSRSSPPSSSRRPRRCGAGHDYLEQTTGLTYAEYVHQGFGQLTVATFLTVVVVGLAMRAAPRETSRDRVLLRALLGALCLLTLAVVASALYRMSLYQDAFGYTVLRVFVDGFELWLGLVVVMLLVAGMRLSGWWVPRAVLVSAAVFALGFAAMNPDAWVASRNIDRFDAGDIARHVVPRSSSVPTPRRSSSSGSRRTCRLRHAELAGDAVRGRRPAERGTSVGPAPPTPPRPCPGAGRRRLRVPQRGHRRLRPEQSRSGPPRGLWSTCTLVTSRPGRPARLWSTCGGGGARAPPAPRITATRVTLEPTAHPDGILPVMDDRTVLVLNGPEPQPPR